MEEIENVPTTPPAVQVIARIDSKRDSPTEPTKLPKERRRDSDESGEETGKPSLTRPGMYSDGSDEEGDGIEETEEDRRFIVGDSEGSEEEVAEKRKSDSDASDSEDASLDEDDLDLVAEVTGKQRKRLKRHQHSGSSSPARERSVEHTPVRKTLDDMFDGERDEEREEFDEEDDLDQFIDDDEGEEGRAEFVDDEEARALRRRRLQEEKQRMRDSARSAGMDTAQYQELMEIFGDGEDYAHLVEKRRMVCISPLANRCLEETWKCGIGRHGCTQQKVARCH
jgi:transcription elongation factor SPT6